MPLLKLVKWEPRITLGDLIQALVVGASMIICVTTMRNDIANLQTETKEIRPLVLKHEKNLAVVNEKLQLKVIE